MLFCVENTKLLTKPCFVCVVFCACVGCGGGGIISRKGFEKGGIQ